MKTYEGIVRSAILAAGTYGEHDGYVLEHGRWSPLIAPKEQLSKFVNIKVSILGIRDGFNIKVHMIEGENGAVWTL